MSLLVQILGDKVVFKIKSVLTPFLLQWIVVISYCSHSGSGDVDPSVVKTSRTEMFAERGRWCSLDLKLLYRRRVPLSLARLVSGWTSQVCP